MNFQILNIKLTLKFALCLNINFSSLNIEFFEKESLVEFGIIMLIFFYWILYFIVFCSVQLTIPVCGRPIVYVFHWTYFKYHILENDWLDTDQKTVCWPFLSHTPPYSSDLCRGFASPTFLKCEPHLRFNKSLSFYFYNLHIWRRFFLT